MFIQAGPSHGTQSQAWRQVDFLRFFRTSEEPDGTRQIEARLFPEDDKEDILGYRFYPLVTMKKSKLFRRHTIRNVC